MLPNVGVEQVWYYLPAEVRKPEEVVREGQGGVTLPAFNHIMQGVRAEAAAHLSTNGIPVTLWSHSLLQDYIAMQVAARILRRIRSYQELANSLFADSNIKLRAFMESEAQVAPDAGMGEDYSEEPVLPKWS